MLYAEGGNKIGQNEKATMLACIVMGLCCHGFSMTNLLLQHDTIPNFAYTELPSIWRGASTGRWLQGLAELPATHINTPFLTGILIILIAAVTAVVINKILGIESVYGCVLTGLLVESFPSMLLYHTLRTVAYPLAVLLAAISVILSRKKIGWLWGGLVLGIAVSIYPPMISIALGLMLMTVLRNILTAQYDHNKQIVLAVARYLGMTVMGGTILIAGTKIAMALTKAEQNNYMGASAAISGSGMELSLIERIKSCYTTFYRLLYSRAEIHPSLRWMVILICVSIFAFCIYLFIENEVYKKPLQAVMLLFIFLLFPIALVTMNLVSDQFDYRAQHRMAFVLIYIAIIMLAEMVYKTIGRKESIGVQKFIQSVRILQYGYLCTAILVIGYLYYDNAYYFNEALITQKDQALMTRIMGSLKEEENFSVSKSPVYFATYWIDDVASSNSPFAYNQDLSWNMPSDGESHMIWFTDANYKEYMKTFLGVTLQDTTSDIYDKIDCDMFQLSPNSPYADESLASGDYKIDKIDDTYVVIIRVKTPVHYDYSR